MLNVEQTTSKQIIDVFKIFAVKVLPYIIVTDNRPQFVLSEFDDFSVHFNIKHLTSLFFIQRQTEKQNVLFKP